MGTLSKRRMRLGSILAVIMMVFLIVAAGACGGTEEAASTPSSSASSGDSGQTSSTIAESTTASTLSLHDRIQQERAGSTTVPSVTTTAEESATTTVSATTTTVHGATTTAQPTSTTAKSTTTTVKPTTTMAKGKVVLTVTGPSGTQELSMADLKAMWATSGYGGWKNQLGNITAPVSWKGVALANLMDLVGGGSSVVVTASDGYEQPLSAGEIGGAVTMYDPATGEEISSISGSITVIVAYEKAGGAIGGEEGPLRLAYVSPQKDQVTDGSAWVRMVTRITVR